MIFKGKCSCSLCSVTFETEKTLSDYQPRVCDCSYCADNPGKPISEHGTVIKVTTAGSTDLVCRRNGDLLADFYHCKNCDDLIVAGKAIEGNWLGALNSELLDDCSKLAEVVPVQPRLLSPQEKVERWKRVWSTLVMEAGGNRTTGVNF